MTDNCIKELFSDIPPMGDSLVILRKIGMENVDDVYEYASNENTTRYLAWQTHQSKKFTKNYVKFLQKQYKAGEFFDWGINLRENGKMVGTCGFTSINSEHSRAEIGYVVNPEYWGQGIATASAKLVTSFAFEQLGINRLEAKFIIGNSASEAVMKKIGMQKEGVLREYMFVKGNYEDICIYSMTAQDYFKQKYGL